MRRGENGIATVGDVGEWAAVDEDRVAFECLYEIWLQGVLEEHRHGAVGFEIAGADGLLIARVGDDDVAETIFEILEILRQAEDGHHFGGDRDIEAVLAREAVETPPKN